MPRWPPETEGGDPIPTHQEHTVTNPFVPHPPRSLAHAVRRAVAVAVAAVAICAAAFGSVAVMVENNQLDMSVQPAAVPSAPAPTTAAA
jgi:hypothetical protein